MEISSKLRQIQRYLRIYFITDIFLPICALILLSLAIFLPFSYQHNNYPYPYRPIFYVIVFGIIILFVLIKIGLYIYLIFSIYKKSRLTYILSFAGLILGLSSFITIIPAVYLLTRWLDPEVKNYYLKSDKP